MADPRFYSSRGPLRLRDVCEALSVFLPAAAASNAWLTDVASLDAAGPAHLAYCADKRSLQQLSATSAGFVIVPPDVVRAPAVNAILLESPEPAAAFSAAIRLFYPAEGKLPYDDTAISETATFGEGVSIAPGAVIGPRAEIGDNTTIGPNAVIGAGVVLGRHCDIGCNVTITHTYAGDYVTVLPGAQIGQSGFGFTSGIAGHTKIPQIGRVILQDGVEVGACTTIDRGALGDTVVGEGSKIDNLVQIGHNCRIGRHCIIVGHVGMSGSCELGDFVVLGGQVGLADHVEIGDGARLAARSAVPPGKLAGGQDYGGAPAIPVRQWRRQMAAYAMLGRRPKQDAN